MSTNVTLSTEARIVSWYPSPDDTTLIAIYTNTRGNRDSFLIARLNLSGEMISTIAHRTTEHQACKRANLAWLTDKYGAAEGLVRYNAKYPANA